MRPPAGLAIRPLTRPELDLAVEWAAAEGWNPGLDDAEAFSAADPAGFLGGFLAGEMVGSVSVVAYGEGFGFLGFYIVRPDRRGRGHGRALWQAGMARLGGRVVGLDGVVAQQAAYARSGFALRHRNIRFGGPAIAREVADAHLVELAGARPLGLAGSVVAYDRPFFPGPREAFLRAWIAPGGRRTVAYVAGGAVRGYGAIRPCRTGYKVGPLFADDPRIGERLLGALTGRIRGETVFLDVPEPNAEGLALAGRHGLRPVFETARMYRGPAPDLPLGRIYGITSFELG